MKAVLVMVALMLIVGGFYLGWLNYRECRAAGFSRFYCSSTTMVR